MTTTRETNPISAIAHLLANFAAWWGFLLTPIYAIGFGLLVPYARAGGPPLSRASLPLALPFVGLSLVVPGCFARDARVAVAVGAALNLVPIALALALRVLQGVE